MDGSIFTVTFAMISFYLVTPVRVRPAARNGTGTMATGCRLVNYGPIMNTIWLQIVMSGVLLVVIAWRTFVDVVATLGTSTANGHPLSLVSFLIVRLVVILLLLWWFAVSWRKRNRLPS
jgi:hypothetical protein